MITIGILNNDEIAVESIQKIQQFNEFKISGVLNSKDFNKNQFALESLLESSEAVFISSKEKLEADYLKKIIRKSVNIFLQQPFFPKLTEIKELISFQQEADCILQIYNPYLFDSAILRMYDKKEAPCLTEINFTLPEKSKFETELLNVLLYLSKTDNSGFRKIDVFALQGERHFVLNLHFQSTSGSVTQLTMSVDENAKPKSKFTVYQKDEAPLVAEIMNSEMQVSGSEKNALKEFINMHKQKNATILSLNDLYLALTLLKEIKEKLKYPNISLSD